MPDPHIISAGEPAARPYDAIVIGAGMSGLTTAVILAKEGMRVVVLEQHSRIGGTLHRFFRKGGVGFDVGFHYVGGVEPGQVLERYLAYCGVMDRLTLIPFDQDGFDELRFPGLRLRVPAGYERYRDRLSAAFPSERAAIQEYCRLMREVVDGFAFYRLRSAQRPEHVERWLSTSLASVVDGLTGDTRLRAVMCGQSPLYGVEPERTPVALHALVTDTTMQHAYTFAGGGDRLAQVMGERLEELGGEVEPGVRAAAIMLDDDRRVRGVRTDQGEELLAPLVVSSANPKVTVSLLPEGALGPAYRRRVLGMEDGISTASIYVTTPADLSAYRGRNLYCYDTSDMTAVYARAGRRRPFLFATVPSAREGTTADGRHLAAGFTLMPFAEVAAFAETRLGARGPAYAECKAEITAGLTAQMLDAIPELRGNVATVEVATPLTSRDYTLSPGGAAYGLHHSIEQSGGHGLKPRTRVQGLHLTGQSVLFPGVVGVTISAFHTAAGIVGAEHLMVRVTAGS